MIMPSMCGLFSLIQVKFKCVFYIMKWILICASIYSPLEGRAQENDNVKLDLSVNSLPIKQVLLQIENLSGYIFSYSPEVLKEFPPVTLALNQVLLKDVLDTLFCKSQVKYEMMKRYIILKKKMRFYTISGCVMDNRSGEILVNASIYDKNSPSGAVTNELGYYSLVLPAGEVSLIFSYVGYTPEIVSLILKSDTIIPIKMRSDLQLNEIVVQNEFLYDRFANDHLGQNAFHIASIETLPKFFSESDVIKVLQTFPGVVSGVEGDGGLYVRGGNDDENLLLWGGVPLYNANHFLGFLSAFNSDAIQHVRIYKSDFPAYYGERLSSVVDIRLKEGDREEYHGNLTAGLLTSKFNLEGPIRKKRSSFNLSVRRTYADLLYPLVKIFVDVEEQKQKIDYHFTDVNLNLFQKFTEKNSLSLNLYWNEDALKFKTKKRVDIYDSRRKQKNQWGNFIAALQWDFMIRPSLSANLAVSFNRYRYRSKGYNGTEGSGISEGRLRGDFKYELNRDNHILFGMNYIYRHLDRFTNTSQFSDRQYQGLDYGIRDKGIHELHLYMEDRISFSERVQFRAGIHLPLYLRGNTTFFSLQPRVMLRYKWNERHSVNISYSKMNQFMRLRRNDGFALPSDSWMPVISPSKPSCLDQWVLGYFFDFYHDWQMSAEIFYKIMAHLPDDYGRRPSCPEWQEKPCLGDRSEGKGEARGIECMIRKNGKQTSGTLNYTYSRSDRWFPGSSINEGKKYPFRYDSRHRVNLTMVHSFSNFFDVSLYWTYNTGYPVTLSFEYYSSPSVFPGKHSMTEEKVIQQFDKRNNVRMPDYHRLDLGFNFRKNERRGVSTWSINLYNAYFRKNPIAISTDFSHMDNGEKQMFYRDWIFPIFPTFSYSYTF